MSRDRTDLGDRLIAAEAFPLHSTRDLQQRLHSMFIRELTTTRRTILGLNAAVALGAAAVCGALAVTELELPLLARAGLGVGALFGLAWAVILARISRRGALDLKLDSRRIAAMAWGFTVLMMVFFQVVGMSMEDRLLGLMMIANGIAFLIGAAVYWLNYRIDQAELDTRERLLQLEFRIAQFGEKS